MVKFTLVRPLFLFGMSQCSLLNEPMFMKMIQCFQYEWANAQSLMSALLSPPFRRAIKNCRSAMQYIKKKKLPLHGYLSLFQELKLKWCRILNISNTIFYISIPREFVSTEPGNPGTFAHMHNIWYIFYSIHTYLHKFPFLWFQ